MNYADKSEYMVTMLENFSAAKNGWSAVRDDWRADARMVSGDPAQQWDPTIKGDLDDAGIPAITFDRISPAVMSVVNATRKDRPQPQVIPGDEGDPQIAEIIEGKLRHLQYVSRAEVAYGHAELCAVIGGIGYYKITKQYVTNRPNSSSTMSYDKEPRVERILDPMSVYFDPSVQTSDFSDAEFCFVRKRYKRAAYRKEFNKEPVSFPFDDNLMREWGDDDKHVWVAEYYWIER